MIDEMKAVLDRFALPSAPVSCERFGCGHINKTYLITTESGARYVLQKINHHVFRNVDGMMENIQAVTAFLAERAADPREILRLVPTKGGAPYHRADDGSCWRIYAFLENTICLQRAETPADFYESAVAVGRFQHLLKEFPAHTLTETIPNFHDTPDRYRIFRQVLQADPMGRAALAREEIAFALAREEEAGMLMRLQREGKLPLRVTHNDTKLNNIMLDADTRKALCIIDLDTVMPGLSVNDYGDSIRFGASSADEDERDLSRVELRLDLFEIFTRGFLQACPGLTRVERQMLPMGAKLMTLECGLRFLTDYLDGDHYFAIHRPAQNLDRCRTQFKLVADMENKWEQMQRIAAQAAEGL